MQAEVLGLQVLQFPLLHVLQQVPCGSRHSTTSANSKKCLLSCSFCCLRLLSSLATAPPSDICRCWNCHGQATIRDASHASRPAPDHVVRECRARSGPARFCLSFQSCGCSARGNFLKHSRSPEAVQPLWPPGCRFLGGGPPLRLKALSFWFAEPEGCGCQLDLLCTKVDISCLSTYVIQ